MTSLTSHLSPLTSLRAIEPEDLDLLYRIENDVRLWNVGTSNVPYSRYVLHDYVANVTNDIYADRQVRMMIDNAEGQTVGIVDLVNFDPANRRAELGLIILNDFRRQGYATATLHQICDYARWEPATGHKGGCGAYYVDTNYKDPSGIPYGEFRKAIQIMNPAVHK